MMKKAYLLIVVAFYFNCCPLYGEHTLLDDDIVAPSIKIFTPVHALSTSLQEAFNETMITALPKKLHHKQKPELSYLFADIKYRDGALKICEFGEGCNAAGNDSEVVFGDETLHINSPYWQLFWHYLSYFKLPVWYVGINPATHYKKNHVMSIREKVAWDDFVAMGGYFTESLIKLEQDPDFQAYAQQENFKAKGFNQYKGIIVFRRRNDRYTARALELKEFKRLHPDFLFLNEISAPYAASKQALAELLKTPELKKLKPTWQIYKKKYTKKLASKIIHDIRSKKMVIKPVNSGRSNGVIMLDIKELDSILKKILIKKTSSKNADADKVRTALNVRPKDPGTIDYWAEDKNDIFLVESQEKSKPLFVHDKWYDPTMRIVFVLACDGEKVATTILGGYWEIPIAGLEDNAPLTDKHRSIAIKEPGYVGLKIEKKDLTRVKKILYAYLPKIYAAMINKHNS